MKKSVQLLVSELIQDALSLIAVSVVIITVVTASQSAKVSPKVTDLPDVCYLHRA